MSKELLDTPTRTLKRNALVAGGSIALAASLSACGSGESTQDVDDLFGPKDTSISTITIGAEARLRSQPYVEDSGQPDNLPIVDPEDLKGRLTVHVQGARVDRDNNGIWYGIDAEDLTVALPDMSAKFLDDKDGIIWVNEQKATVGDRL